MSLLVISNGSSFNPQTIDLSQYVDVNEGEGLDPADPGYTNRVWSHSLQKQGATLSLEQLVEREMVFPIKLGPIGGLSGAPTTLSQTLQLIQRVNMILETPGATLQWEPPGASQATTFDVLSGLMEIAYNYRAEGQAWEFANLRVFTQPLGRTASPRVYATASGVGPLLMISPYASGGALATVASGTGFGASGGVYGPNGASGGVSYWGNPSLVGDAPVQLQISYVGPLPNNATEHGTVPWLIASLLPDPLYRPLVTAQEIVQTTHGTTLNPGGGATETVLNSSTAIASSYRHFQYTGNGAGTIYGITWAFNPLPQASDSAQDPSVLWSGSHRVFAIARASTSAASAALYPAALVPAPGGLLTTSASVYVPYLLDWGLYDVGTFTLRPSEMPSLPVMVSGIVGNSACSLDLNAFIMVPDNASWFLPPTSLALNASQYGVPSTWYLSNTSLGFAPAPYTNTFVLDDVLGDQFIYQGASQTFAPSPIGSVPSSARVTQYSRGLVPTPDPKNGLPILALISLAQNVASPLAVVNHIAESENIPGASWANPQNLPAYAQVNVLERFRYVSS